MDNRDSSLQCGQAVHAACTAYHVTSSDMDLVRTQHGCVTCPNCKVHYGVRTGVQPKGVMVCDVVPVSTGVMVLSGYVVCVQARKFLSRSSWYQDAMLCRNLLFASTQMIDLAIVLRFDCHPFS